jgi:26S proteasome regulatory subunit N1
VNEIKSSTSSMTSVPKPLKFLRPHYSRLQNVYNSWPIVHPMKRLMADMMSVLAMTMASHGSRECLKYKLQGSSVNVSAWGHEYVRSLSGEISEEYNQRLVDTPAEEGEPDVVDLMNLVDDILPWQMKHNAEAEAVDLLLEVCSLPKLMELPDLIDERNYQRVCLYLIRSAAYIEDPDEVTKIWEVTYSIFKRLNKYTDALRIAMKTGNSEKIQELFASSEVSEGMKLQMAFILGHERSSFVVESNEKYNEIIGNNFLSSQFLAVGRDMDITAPKAPEDIYKTHLAEGIQPFRRGNNAAAAVNNFDQAKMNLASSFVTAFVNPGLNKDKRRKQLRRMDL